MHSLVPIFCKVHKLIMEIKSAQEYIKIKQNIITKIYQRNLNTLIKDQIVKHSKINFPKIVIKILHV